MAQHAQDAHESRHFLIAEQIAPDHFTRVLRDPEYWRKISYQERNNNLLLSETIKLIEQMKVASGDIDIIECGIEIGYSEWMYHSQMGMFAIIMIPPFDHEQLARLHGMAFGIPRIDDFVYKCEQIPGKLFTNASCKAPDWVLSPEGEVGARVIISAWPADIPYYETQLPTPPSSDHVGHTEECTRLPIPEGCLISALPNGQSGDQQPQTMAED